MQKITLLMLRGYRYFISPWLGQCCRYHPSCSEYAQHCIADHGVLRGSWLTLRRLARCHPWHEGGYDPAPQKSPHL